MENLEFEWDLAKSRSNVRKHGVGFPEATTVFRDRFARMRPERVVDSELREVMVGVSEAGRLLVVASSIEGGSESSVRGEQRRLSEMRTKKPAPDPDIEPEYDFRVSSPNPYAERASQTSTEKAPTSGDAPRKAAAKRSATRTGALKSG